MGVCVEETRAQAVMKICMVLALVGFAASDFVEHLAEDTDGQLARTGRQESVQGGVDFSGCSTDPDTGLCCVEKTEEVTTLKKDPILECTHKNTEQCHYTYVR